MADIVLINPRFEVSYWGLEHALPLLGKKGNLPVACLPLLAALTPAEHRVTLVDENVEPIDYDRFARADIVGLTGMSVQRVRMREILAELKAPRRLHRRRRAVGHACRRTTSTAWPTSIFIGEAEETWPQFLDEWEHGRHQHRYEQVEQDRHDQGAGAAVRPAEDAALPLRQHPVLPRLPVPVRVLRHHRHLRPPAAAQDERPGHRRAGGAARAEHADRLHRRRQPDRQQEGDQAAAARRGRVASRRRLPLHVLHRGVARPGRRRGADGADGRGQHRGRLHRHREPQRGVAARDEEVPERPQGRHARRAGPQSRTPGWRSGAG